MCLWIGTGLWFWVWVIFYGDKAERNRYQKYIKGHKENYLPDIKSEFFASVEENEILKESNEPKCPYCGATIIDKTIYCESCKTGIVNEK